MSRHLLPFILVFGLATGTYGQNTGYAFKIQYGMSNYVDLGSLDKFQEMVQTSYDELGLPVKMVQSFPIVPELGFQMIIPLPELYVGGFINSSANGGRFHYSDYSGSITFDYTLSNLRYGVLLKPPEFKLRSLRLSQTLQLGRMSSTFEFHEDVEVWEETQTDRMTLETTAYFIEPGVELDFLIHQKWSLGAYLGINLNLKTTPYHLPRNDKAMFSFENGHKLLPDWKELKLGVSITYVDN